MSALCSVKYRENWGFYQTIYVNKDLIFDLIGMSSKKSTRFYQENKTKYNKMYKKVHAQQK